MNDRTNRIRSVCGAVEPAAGDDRGGPTLLDRLAAFLRWNPVSTIMPPLRKFLLHFHVLSVKPYFQYKPLPVS